MVFREGRYQRNHAEAIGRIKRERGEKETSNRIGLHQHQAVMLPLVRLTTPLRQLYISVDLLGAATFYVRPVVGIRQFGCLSWGKSEESLRAGSQQQLLCAGARAWGPSLLTLTAEERRKLSLPALEGHSQPSHPLCRTGKAISSLLS